MKSLWIVITMAVFISMSTASLAQIDYCEGNFDYDQDVDGTDAFQFKTDFGRQQYTNSCPPDGPSPVAKTGQITSYGTADDGDLEKGLPWPDQRFGDNGDGTVIDRLTGLIWLKNANCFGVATWNQALVDCTGLASGSCNLTDDSSPGDWRLPNSDELLSLIDRSQISPALPAGTPFTGVQSSEYWSSTTSAYSTDFAWYVFFEDGFSDFDPKTTESYVWPVRGGR